MFLKKAMLLAPVLLILCAALSLAAASPYFIDVDIANQIVTVYDTDDLGESGIVRQMICSTGMGNGTPRGLFSLPEKKYETEREEWYYFSEYEIWAKYATRIDGPFLFHSVLFKSRNSASPTWSSYNALGSKASHGCVRLRVEDAQWIAENCPVGTLVYIFDDGATLAPLSALLKIRSFAAEEQTYDAFKREAAAASYRQDKAIVAAMQGRLTALGYNCGAADGIWGKRTNAALRAWQADQGLTPSDALTTDQLKALAGITDAEIDAFCAEIAPQDAIIPAEALATIAASSAGGAEMPSVSDAEHANGDAPAATEASAETAVDKATDREADSAPEAETVSASADETPNASAPLPDAFEADDAIARVCVGETSYLNLRQKPDAQAPKRAVLHNGDWLKLINHGLVWSEVETPDGVSGWVGSKYIEIIDSKTYHATEESK